MTIARMKIYRLWKDGTWDTVDASVETMNANPSVEDVEYKACEQVWLAMRGQENKPLQIGVMVATLTTNTI